MHNTGNPLGSTQILDLYDNSESIDNYVNSQEDSFPDRFGTKRLTLAGLIKRSMALRNEINDFSGALTFKPEWSDVPMNISEGVGGEGGALNLQAEALGNRSEINKVTSREALRRSYAEAGYNLVDGSFELGGVLSDPNDVLLCEKDSSAWAWVSAYPHNVPEGTIPVIGSGYVPRTDVTLRSDLASESGSELVGYQPAGIGAVATTVQSKLRETVSVKDFGANGGGVTDDTVAFIAGNTAAAGGTLFAPTGTYNISSITIGQNNLFKTNTNFYGDGPGTVIVPSKDNTVVLTASAGSGWRQPQFFSNFVIKNSYSKTNITALALDGRSHVAGLRIEDVEVLDADVCAFDLSYCQFGRFYNLVAHGSFALPYTSVGFRLQPQTAGGGSNSNDFYAPVAVNNAVGVLVDGATIKPASGTPWGTVANNFYNAQINGNTVGWAFYYSQANIYGGSPEANAQAGVSPTSVTVFGRTIPACTMYLDNSNINCYGWTVEEYGGVNASFMVNNNSVLSLTDFSGYPGFRPGSFGELVRCDATSVVNFYGSCDVIGVVSGVGVWPKGFNQFELSSNSKSWAMLIGSPILKEDSSFSPLVSAQAPKINTYGGSPATLTYVNDTQLGYSAQLACTTVKGGSVNQIPLSPLSANSTIVISLLIKSDRDCVVSILFMDGAGVRRAGNDTSLQLIANVPKRVVISRNSYAAGTSGTLNIQPWDTTGPVLTLSNVVVYEGVSESAGTVATVAKIIGDGSFNPGKTRETQANIQSKTASINLVNKYPGKQIWDTTNNRVLYASGNTDVSAWKDGAGAVIYTPA